MAKSPVHNLQININDIFINNIRPFKNAEAFFSIYGITEPVEITNYNLLFDFEFFVKSLLSMLNITVTIEEYIIFTLDVDLFTSYTIKVMKQNPDGLFLFIDQSLAKDAINLNKKLKKILTKKQLKQLLKKFGTLTEYTNNVIIALNNLLDYYLQSIKRSTSVQATKYLTDQLVEREMKYAPLAIKHRMHTMLFNYNAISDAAIMEDSDHQLVDKFIELFDEVIVALQEYDQVYEWGKTR